MRSISLVTMTILVVVSISIPMAHAAGTWKERPEESLDEYPVEDDPPVVVVPTPAPRPNLDPYRCDHLLSFREKREEFVECCRSFPRRSFFCPNLTPPGHVCGIPHPPMCCRQQCPPPPTTTTTTTTEASQEDDESDEEDEED